MTDKQKIRKMFEIRKKECPELLDVAETIEPILFVKGYIYYHKFLKMYDERYGGKE